MSFILDALKKSENERQRTMGPSLADAPLRRARADRPWWAIAVAALLAINLGVLIVVLMRDNAAAKPQDTATTSAAAQSAAPVMDSTSVPEPADQPALLPAQPILPAAGAPRTVTNPAVHSLAQEAGSAALQGGTEPYAYSGTPSAAAVRPGPPLVRPIQPPTVTPLPDDPTFKSVAAGTDASRNNEVLPTAGDLAASGTNVPDLKLDIHVFSKNPAERFVFVNMRKYLEGQTLQEGPTLERITDDGVILNQHGLRYALPRQ